MTDETIPQFLFLKCDEIWKKGKNPFNKPKGSERGCVSDGATIQICKEYTASRKQQSASDPSGVVRVRKSKKGKRSNSRSVQQ
jgi:hypothetical protein